jgi:hypothetical protein
LIRCGYQAFMRCRWRMCLIGVSRQMSEPSDVNQLFSINVDGTGLTQLTNTVGLNVFPTPIWLRVRTECASFDF